MEIGITGGIGVGKSLVCKIFQTLSIPVYDADHWAKWIMNNSVLVRRELEKSFGTDVFNTDGLNRQYLAKMVFSDKQKLQQLNSIVHPEVSKHYQDWVKEHADSQFTLKEAALLFESGSNKSLHKIILVTAPLEMRIQRIQKRDPQRSEQEIRDIIGQQMAESTKRELADFEIVNDERHSAIQQSLTIYEKLSSIRD